MRELGEQLEEHIRLEERVVFPWAEQVLPEDAFREVSAWLTFLKTGRPEPWASVGADASGPRTGPGGDGD